MVLPSEKRQVDHTACKPDQVEFPFFGMSLILVDMIMHETIYALGNGQGIQSARYFLFLPFAYPRRRLYAKSLYSETEKRVERRFEPYGCVGIVPAGKPRHGLRERVGISGQENVDSVIALVTRLLPHSLQTPWHGSGVIFNFMHHRQFFLLRRGSSEKHLHLKRRGHQEWEAEKISSHQ